MRNHLLLLVFLFASFNMLAQHESDSLIISYDENLRISQLPYHDYGEGYGVTTKDSLFQLNIRLRMQNRYTAEFNEGSSINNNIQIRRMRLRFDGFVFNPKFRYLLQMSLDPSEFNINPEFQNQNLIRDALIVYQHNQNWMFAFGQGVLPTNRQMSNSSRLLQLSDRSINNSLFSADRDLAFHVSYSNLNSNCFSYAIRTALSSGNGRKFTQSEENKLAYTARVELYPFGNFNDTAFSEGDLDREQTPKLMLSGAYHYNPNALLSRGTRGSLLFEQRNQNSLFFDALLKYNGWAFQAAYMNRTTQNPITVNPENNTQTQHVMVGNGFDTQLSYLFLNDIELTGRYSRVNPESKINHLVPKTDQFTLGATKYIWEHKFKMQAEISHNIDTFYNAQNQNNWYFRFQVEIGI